MKKILFAIMFAALCAGCSESGQQWIQHAKEGSFGGSYVVKRIAVPSHLALTNTVYTITPTNAMLTFLFGIETGEIK